MRARPTPGDTYATDMYHHNKGLEFCAEKSTDPKHKYSICTMKKGHEESFHVSCMTTGLVVVVWDVEGDPKVDANQETKKQLKQHNRAILNRVLVFLSTLQSQDQPISVQREHVIVTRELMHLLNPDKSQH